MQELEDQVELVLRVDHVQQPESAERGTRRRHRSCPGEALAGGVGAFAHHVPGPAWPLRGCQRWQPAAPGMTSLWGTHPAGEPGPDQPRWGPQLWVPAGPRGSGALDPSSSATPVPPGRDFINSLHHPPTHLLDDVGVVQLLEQGDLPDGGAGDALRLSAGGGTPWGAWRHAGGLGLHSTPAQQQCFGVTNITSARWPKNSSPSPPSPAPPSPAHTGSSLGQQQQA